mmetsp:Transcript_20644/g.44947  ORF Transcript_20644/g.44947 Transcript_20644/m.44947 type:complete len:147 (+) Transcript_20644:198-638(+)
MQDLCLPQCYSRTRVANCTKGKARKLPLSKPKKTENVIISDARSCIVEVEPTRRGENMNAVETKRPLLNAKSSCTKSEKKSFLTTISLSLPVVVLHKMNSGKNPTRSIAPKTSFRDKSWIRSTGMYPEISLPNKSPMLKKTKLKGT